MTNIGTRLSRPMTKRPLIAVASCLVALAAHGTAQQPDVVVFEGQTYKLHSNPLEDYFVAHPDNPHPSEPPEDGPYVSSTALWRGYVATFGFEDGVLVLRGLETLSPRGMEEDEPRMVSSVDRYFPDAQSRICDWFSGLLVLPHGELRSYVHLGYGSIYEFQTLLRIRNGQVVDRADFTYDEYLNYKRRLFALYMETPEYQRAFEFYRQADEEVMEESEVDVDETNQFIFDGGGWERFVDLEFAQTSQAK
jgi:hypothetical protein